MKKILALALAAVMCFAMVACGEKKDEATENTETTETVEVVETVETEEVKQQDCFVLFSVNADGITADIAKNKLETLAWTEDRPDPRLASSLHGGRCQGVRRHRLRRCYRRR